MTKPLTKSELYQFSLSGSSATTIPAQRAAIARCGLSGATPATVRNARQAAFRAFRAKHPELAKHPAWLAAAQFEASGDDWLHVAPVPAGKARNVSRLARLAYDAIDWGRLRKHSLGDATAFAPRVREETNGKSGWDCVVWRYADYLCVVSPDGKQIAIQTTKTGPVEIHSVWRNQCLYQGSPTWLVERPLPRKSSVGARATARRLRLHGFDARVIRQTSEMISAGSGDNIRSGGHIVIVVADCLGGWYHATAGESPESVRTALNARRRDARQAELDRIIHETGRIWVTIDDSTTAGNCRPGTTAFAETVFRSIGATGEVGAVTASAILAVRDDEFTRRACRAAALRLGR